jgi:hypothetical protein
MTGVRKLVWVVAALLSLATVCLAQAYQARGVFRSEAFSPRYKGGGEPCFVLEGEFSVTVEGPQSVMEYSTKSIVYHLDEFESSEAGAILACNGTNYYELILPQRTTNTKVIPSGRIWNGPVPERADDKLATLWLAFASQCYFKTADPDLIYSPLANCSPAGRSCWTRDHRVRAAWSVMPDSPGLPLSVVHGSKFVPSVERVTPIDSNVVYRVLTTTNLNGITVPRSFQLSMLFPAGRLTGSFSGEVTDLKTPIPSPNFIPPLPGPTFIVDERFIARRGNPSANYLVKSTNWPTLEQGESNLTRTVHADSQAPRTSVRRVALIAMALLTIVPVALLLKHNKQTRKES